MLKKLLGIAGILLLTFTSCFADYPALGLTLTGVHLPDEVVMRCNSIADPQIIPMNGSLLPLRWSIVVLMFGGHNNLDCTFRLDDPITPTLLGELDMNVMNWQGEVLNVRKVPLGYAIKVNPDVNIFYPGVEIQVIKTRLTNE